MILDSIENAEFYQGLNPKIKKAFDFLKNTDLKSLDAGKYFIEEPDVYAIVQGYTTKEAGTADLEAHRKFTDLQFVVEGRELMGYANLADTSEKAEYDCDKDLIFLNGKANFFIAEAGTFAIFFPTDAHMPSMCVNEPSSVKKIVIKIAL